MKIFHTPLFPGRPGPQPGDPAGAAERSDAQAARFADFGMFGAKEKKPGLQHAVRHAPASPSPNLPSSGPGTKPAEAAGPPDRLAASAQDPLLPRPLLEPASPQPRHASPMPRPGEPCQLPEAAPAKPEYVEDGATAATDAPSPERRRRPAPPIPSVRLTILEANGVVELIAGSAPIGPDSRVLLRRLVEAMLARSGLALAHFRINGAPVAPIPYNRGGQ